MRLTIVNSTAPGPASLLAPFFEALADCPGVELAVLEQVPAWHRNGGSNRAAAASDAPRRYRLELLPAHFYNRRHASVQVLSGRFRRLLAKTDPDVIYILGEPGYLSTYQVVRFARRHLQNAKLCLLTAQNVYQRFPPPFPKIEQWVLSQIEHAFPIGRDHEDVLRRKGYRGPATHLPLGVDTRAFTPDRRPRPMTEIGLPRPVVGYVGDLLPARNVPLLIEALSLCPVPVGLLIVGDGPRRFELESVAMNKGLDGRVKFVGRVPHTQVPEYINCLDVLVLPSKAVRNRRFGVFQIANAEQFGRVLVEAMACGKPVVGSSCGEIPEVIGNAGRVFPEGDEKALASVLEELCRDKTLRERLGQAGLARARARYDWHIIAGQLLSVMRGMLAPAARPAQAGIQPDIMAYGAAAKSVMVKQA